MIASEISEVIAYLQSEEVKRNPNNKPLQQKAGTIIGQTIGLQRKPPGTNGELKNQIDLKLEELKATLEMINQGGAIALGELYKNQISKAPNETKPIIVAELNDQNRAKEFKDARTWDQTCQIVVQGGQLQPIHQKPLTKTYKFGERVQDEVAIPALKLADDKEKISDYKQSIYGREDDIHDEKEPYGPKPLKKLRELIFNWDDKVKDAKNLLLEAFRISLTKRSETSKNSAELRANLENRFGRLNENEEAHHIVPSTHQHESAILARDILKKHGININDIQNGVILPQKLHRGLHTNQYIDKVFRRLSIADKTNNVNVTLMVIADEIKNEIF